MRDLPRPRTEPLSPALATGLNHWTTREVPFVSIYMCVLCIVYTYCECEVWQCVYHTYTHIHTHTRTLCASGYMLCVCISVHEYMLCVCGNVCVLCICSTVYSQAPHMDHIPTCLVYHYHV